MDKSTWSTEFPTAEGHYWFYGYLFGKEGYFGKDNKPKIVHLQVLKTSNSVAYVSEGKFVFESEVENAHFQKIILPELPKLK